MKKIFLCLSLIAMLLLSLPVSAAGKASFALSPSSASYKVGEQFSLGVLVNPESETVDTVRVKISFPADKLKIQSFSFGPTFSYQSAGNGYDNSAGTFSYGAGVPGGVSQASAFGTIVFKVYGEGQAAVNILTDSLILSSGENKFDGAIKTATFSLLPAAPVNTPSPTPILTQAVSSPSPSARPSATPVASQTPQPSEEPTKTPLDVNQVQSLPTNQNGSSILASIFTSFNIGVGLLILAAALIIAYITVLRKPKRNLRLFRR